MNQAYPFFYRETGVRRFNELLSPRINLFKGFPRNSIYHHLTNDDELFQDASKPWFKGYAKRLPFELVYRTETIFGRPRELPFVPQRYTLPFLRKHHEFKYVPNVVNFPVDQRTLMIVNYNPLKLVYRYFHTPISDYQKWETIHKTFWSGIANAAMKTSRQQFVLMDPIHDIPSFNLLLNFADKEGMTLTRLFNNDDKRFILHLTNFFNEELREKSIFNVIPQEALKNINLIFLLKDGRCSTINFSYLYSWLKGNENVSAIKVSIQRDKKIFLRALLKYFLVISSNNPEEVSEQIPVSEEDRRNEDSEMQEEDDGHQDSKNDEFFSNSVPVNSVVKPKAEFVPNELKPTAVLDQLDEEDHIPESALSSIDADLEVLEKKSRDDLHKRGIKLNGKTIVEVETDEKVYSHEAVYHEVHTSLAPNESLNKKLDEALEIGNLNAASYKKAKADALKYIKSEDPYGSDVPTKDQIVINPTNLLIKEDRKELVTHKTVFDESMNQSALNVYTHDYITRHMRQDVLKCVGALQKGGVIIQNHDVSIERNIMGAVEHHRLELKPIDGVTSSVWFKLPVIEHDGSFTVGGNKYFSRKQRVDLPIRKISPNEVSLNSYYGKCFVSTESRMTGSTSAWILKQIDKATFEGSDWITHIVPGDTFKNDSKTPYIYGLLSTRFVSFKVGDLFLNFNNDINVRMTPPREDLRWCGNRPSKDDSTKSDLVWVGQDTHFYVSHNGKLEDLGDVYKVFRLNQFLAPVRYSELALFRKNVPIGVVLGYKLGWSKLLALLEVTPRFIEPKKRLNLEPDEYPISFLNGTYIFSKKNQLATLVLAGFMEYYKVTKNYELKEFENKDVYLNLLSSRGLGSVYIREIDMLFDYFIDPITEEILVDMKEPTTFEGLLLKASELLLTYQHPKQYDGAYTRIRGYERFSGTVYREMTAAIRQFRSKNIAGRSKIDISPYKIWQSINEDPTKMLIPEINPVQDLKNDESVTYVGEGGRSADGINKASRSFHVSDVGVISEGTVDSSDVGVNIYASSDPLLKNHRGLKLHDTEVQNANRHCSAVLLAPFAINDDQNRINFINIQNSHTIPAKGYHAPYVRTGYETLIAQRLNPAFAYCAKEDGKVIAVNDKGVIIEYKSKVKIGLAIGRQFGRAEGSVFPFDIEACVKENKTFKKGDPIVYNTSYFEFDPWNPGQLVLKHSLTAKTVLWETKQTHEDASSISQSLSKKLGTRVTYVRSFLINFEQNIHNVVKPGDKVSPSDILMTIEDEITSNLGSFGENSIETLKSLSKQSPRCNYHGIVDRIEVFYHGDKDQMTTNLRKLAEQSNLFIAEQAKATAKPKYTGEVTDDYRFEGTPVGLNKAELRFYITVETNMGVADKIVLGNQMKSVNSEVMNYTLTTESGEAIDVQFGCRSIAARNVLSPYKLGTTTTLLKLIAQNAVKLYNE